jgi:hypothetical protein
MEEEIQPETETRNLPRAFPATANYVGRDGKETPSFHV